MLHPLAFKGFYLKLMPVYQGFKFIRNVPIRLAKAVASDKKFRQIFIINHIVHSRQKRLTVNYFGIGFFVVNDVQIAVDFRHKKAFAGRFCFNFNGVESDFIADFCR